MRQLCLKPLPDAVVHVCAAPRSFANCQACSPPALPALPSLLCRYGHMSLPETDDGLRKALSVALRRDRDGAAAAAGGGSGSSAAPVWFQLDVSQLPSDGSLDVARLLRTYARKPPAFYAQEDPSAGRVKPEPLPKGPKGAGGARGAGSAGAGSAGSAGGAIGAASDASAAPGGAGSAHSFGSASTADVEPGGGPSTARGGAGSGMGVEGVAASSAAAPGVVEASHAADAAVSGGPQSGVAAAYGQHPQQPMPQGGVPAYQPLPQ